MLAFAILAAFLGLLGPFLLNRGFLASGSGSSVPFSPSGAIDDLYNFFVHISRHISRLLVLGLMNEINNIAIYQVVHHHDHHHDHDHHDHSSLT
jgi:hypothetical protein